MNQLLFPFCAKYCFLKVLFGLQIKPLVKPTKTIVTMSPIRYTWHDLVSESKQLVSHSMDILFKVWYVEIYFISNLFCNCTELIHLKTSIVKFKAKWRILWFFYLYVNVSSVNWCLLKQDSECKWNLERCYDSCFPLSCLMCYFFFNFIIAYMRKMDCS